MRKEQSLTDAEKKLHEYGKEQIHNLEDGTIIQVLPTCAVPLNTLLEKNWRETINSGCFRSVFIVKSLKNGTPADIVVKSPERSFDKDGSWWGGPRGNGGRVEICNNPLVEGMIVWEAIFLLELDRLEILAEKPYAIVTKPDGHKQLIVGQVGPGMEVKGGGGWSWGGLDIVRAKVENSGLSPNDFQALNVNKPGIYKMGTREEYGDDWYKYRTEVTPPIHIGDYIIDVNRWMWSPYTDVTYKELKQLVKNLVCGWEKKHS